MIGLVANAVIVLCSTAPPTATSKLAERIHAHSPGISFVGAPVSGGTARAAAGTLTVMASASSPSELRAAMPFLRAFAGTEANLHLIGGGAEAGNTVKLVNQHLAGTHIAAAAEALAFAARIGVDTRKVYEALKERAGFMFTNRMPRALVDDRKPESKVEIFVKDLVRPLGCLSVGSL
jgi:3-hydroxyisobutyrate dehydrogenase-like beta-hydroxyacid dehydrogenase